MALRVLLADESASIKKVIQLTLQDFAVELKTVNLGVDVLEVAQSFAPDIILVDILLQKLDGYEVCKQIKTNTQLKSIPVVLMWSGFMSIDEEKFTESGAEAKLEKPFNAQNLRQLVGSLIPKLQEGSSFHDHIEVPEISTEEEIKPLQEKSPTSFEPPPVTADPEDEPTKAWDMSSFDDLPDPEAILPQPEEPNNTPINVQENTLPTFDDLKNEPETAEEDSDGDEAWVNESISKFKLDIPELSEDENSQAQNFQQDEIKDTSFLWKPEDSVTSVGLADETPDEPEDFSQVNLNDQPIENTTQEPVSYSAIDPKLLEKIITQEAQKIIEEAVWKIVPELATTIIKKEIERLTKDAEA